jgi:hypothetical protein
VEQLVARWAHNPKVTGSSPVPATQKATQKVAFLFLYSKIRCMSFYVYVLHSVQHDKIYIGYSSDLESRLKSHNELATKGWTVKW